MIIEKDELYGQYVVWKREDSLYIEMFKSKNKKDCTAFIHKNKKASKSC